MFCPKSLRISKSLNITLVTSHPCPSWPTYSGNIQFNLGQLMARTGGSSITPIQVLINLTLLQFVMQLPYGYI